MKLVTNMYNDILYRIIKPFFKMLVPSLNYTANYLIGRLSITMATFKEIRLLDSVSKSTYPTNIGMIAFTVIALQ